MATAALSELLGSTVYDASGAASGRVREVALAPQEDRSRDRSAHRQNAFREIACCL